MIEKYNITGWKAVDRTIFIPEAKYNRLLESVYNKPYIFNLRKYNV
mgnify:CR=1 FL=1